MAQLPKLDKNEKVIILGALGIGVLYFGLLNPLLHFLGVKTGADTVTLDQQASNPGSFWQPSFWRNTTNPMLLTRASAEALAREIYNASGYWNDDEDKIKAIFKSLNFQTQVSFLADVFNQLYGADLLSWLRGGIWPQDRFSDADISEITKYLLKLPLK